MIDNELFMFEELEKAIDTEDYEIAQQIIDELDSKLTDKLWLKYYQSLILEKQENLEKAEQNYRQIIKDIIYPDPKLLKLIRNGIERIIAAKKEEKEEQKQVFTKIENSDNLAVLILENITLEEKQKLAPDFAKIMEIDRYTATLQIPTRSWRLYKTGQLGELNYYQSELAKIGLPCFCQPLNKINSMTVYQVKYLEINDDKSQFRFYSENEQGQEEIIDIAPQQINGWVKAMLPLFELTVNIDKKNQIQKKKSTLDYIAFFDLHSSHDNAIFRFSDRAYQFEQDQNIQQESNTTKDKWQNLENNLQAMIPSASVWSNFTLFAEGVIQFPEMLKQVKSHVHLFRREDTLWDEAFQLYSGLIFLQNKESTEN
jgi:hypothetical protein